MELSQGLRLKGRWELIAPLGEGACASVWTIRDTRAPGGVADDDATLVAKLSRLPPPGAKKGGKKKSEAERVADALFWEHQLYACHLRGLEEASARGGGGAVVPKVPAGAYGEEHGWRFLVMERLGHDLTCELALHGGAGGAGLAPARAAALARAALRALAALHQRNVLFVDVKPENFCLAAPARSGSAAAASGAALPALRLIDFGVAELYMLGGRHKAFKSGAAGCAGTPAYCSLAAHGGDAVSRRDDIEVRLVHARLVGGGRKGLGGGDGVRTRSASSPSARCVARRLRRALGQF